MVPAEKVDRELEALFNLASDRGALAARQARKANARLIERTVPNLPRMRDVLFARALRALTSEVLIAHPVDESGDIEPTEREEEILKRALARLRLPRLRAIAEELNLEARGTLDDVATAIVKAYGADEEDLARLILEYEEARPDTGIVDRIYPLRDSVTDINKLASLVAPFANSYIRVGIAKWFIFQSAVVAEASLTMRGELRAYRAEATREGDEIGITPRPTEAGAGLIMREGENFLLVDGRGDNESRALLAAFEGLTKVQRDELVVKGFSPEGALMRWHATSALLVDFLESRLQNDNVAIINLTSARFESPSTAEVSWRRPAVTSVAFHGQHILSSRSACELLMEGRVLSEVSLVVRFRDAARESLVPIRLALSTENATVLTSLGSTDADTSRQLHKLLVSQMKSSVSAGIADPARLRTLAEQVAARAAQDAPVAEADIFAPPSDWHDELD